MNSTEDLFQNNQLHVQQLPAVAELEFIPLEAEYKTVRYLASGIFASVVFLVSWIVVLLSPSIWPYGIYAAILVSLLCVWSVIYSGISFHYMGYAMRDKDVTYKSGWIWQSVTSVPFNRVQHCDIRQGLIDRQFNLAKLTIYTAGGQSTDIEIPGLLQENAEKLKAYILNSTEEAIEEEA